METSGKDVAREAQEKNEERESVAEKVKKELLEKCKGDDGKVDLDKLLEEAWRRDERLHYTRKEAKDRREREEQYLKELEERSNKLKQKEEEELKKEKKYEELLQKKEGELSEYTQKVKELEGFKNTVVEQQKAEIDVLKSGLGKNELEIYETATQGVGEDNYTQRLALIKKLSSAKPSVEPPPTGKVAKTGDGLTLSELKEKDPDAYRKKLREDILGSTKSG